MATNEQRSFILFIDFYDKIRFLNDQHLPLSGHESRKMAGGARPLGRGPGGTLAARTQGSERPLER